MTMTRRSFVGSMVPAAFGAAPALQLASKTTAEKLNVLFIASDDLNTSLGCYGHPIVRSPNIDRLASRAVRFDRAYCNFPLCGPSRTSLLSGRRPDTTKIWANQIAVRDKLPDVVTLPQMFRNNGWHAARWGKMYHMNVPDSVGTNLWDDPQSWDVAVSPPGLELKTSGQGRNITPPFPSGNGMNYVAFSGDGAGQADLAAAEGAIETFDKHGGQGVFVGLGFLRPHVPHVAPSRFFDLYPLDKMTLAVNPANDRDDIPRASEITITGRGNHMGMDERDQREGLRAYYASISYMDSLVGRVLDHLDKRNLRRRTVVVLWSDHGWHLGEHFRWQKRSLFEESARVPLIVSAPSRRGNGKASPALVELVDLYPALAQLAGITAPPGYEGQSFVPLLDNPARPWKQAAFTQVWTPPDIVGRSVRTLRHRYIRWEGSHPGEELYDEVADPREFTNLAADPKHAATLKQLQGVLDRGWRAAMV